MQQDPQPYAFNRIESLVPVRFPLAVIALVAITYTSSITAQRPGTALPAARDSLVITFLANEGVMITSGSASVLIDALFGDGLSDYGMVTQPTRTALERAQPPFDRVTAVLTTHIHHDHFEARPVFEHLKHNPRARFISSPEAVAQVRAVDRAATPDMASRLIAMDPPKAQRVRATVIGSTTIYALGLPHGVDERLPINVGFVVDIGGRRIMHVGDGDVSPAEFASMRLGELGIDVALLSPHYLTNAGFREAVRRDIRPKTIAVIHGPPLGREAGVFGRSRSEWDGAMRDVRKEFPDAHFFTRQMETLVIR